MSLGDHQRHGYLDESGTLARDALLSNDNRSASEAVDLNRPRRPKEVGRGRRHRAGSRDDGE
jgi:hypothetical protein